jgi:hypothetical protein
VSVASGIPWMFPEGDVSGVLKSAWASSQITPVLPPPERATPETVPIEMEWSPPRKIGNSPSETTASARPATSSQTARTASRCLTLSSLSTSSGMGTRAFPRSVTGRPNSSMAASMRA